MIFKCKNCGGNTVYSPAKETMYCPQCDSLDSHEKISSNIMTECANCGAPLEIGEYTSALRCSHCGSYIILEERVEGEFEPEFVLPFKVSKNEVVGSLKHEFKRRIFTPSAFLSHSSLEKMEGIYVPFFMYDYHSDIHYEGKGVRVRTWQSGNTEYTERSYYSVERDIKVDFDKIPVDASEKMDDRIMDLMEPYEYQALINFKEQFLSGFEGERYNQSAEELKQRAKDKVNQDSKMILQDALSGYTTMMDSKENIALKELGQHYALLPVWRYQFDFRGKSYLFHVNGQTGKIIGKTPVSMKRVNAYSFTVLGVTCIALLLIKYILGGI